MPSNSKKSIVILGAGIAGLASARLLSENGLDVTVIEKSSGIGGHVANWGCMATSECQVCHCCSLSDLIAALDEGPVRFMTGWQLESINRGLDGQLSGVIVIENESGNIQEIPADALLISIGFETFDPSSKGLWGYGVFDGVITLAEFDDFIREDRLSELVSNQDPAKIAFFQCVGSRDKSIGANYCSQYCCKAGLRSAIRIKTDKPDWDVSLFYIDLQVAGKYATTLLHNARELGIHLIQGVPGEVFPDQGNKLGVISEKNGSNVRDQFDRIILSVGQRPNPVAADISRMTGVALDNFGFFRKLEDLDRYRTSEKGIYVAGACSGPMDIETTLISAEAATADILEDLSNWQEGS